ncbi:ANTAR domain-containing protein [Streptomyces sp. NPDC004042]|uniref:ANTAR domain-containing protein n=1 Tax=Streptomyces sp. NPDC004042 TaxID=3154451 RepID=UPI0033A9DE33
MTVTYRARARLDEATGIVAIVGGVTRERARAVLGEMAAHTRIKEQHVAELVVEWAVSGRLPAELRRELGRRLDAGQSAPAAEPAG